MVNRRVGFNMEYRVLFHSGTVCYRKIPCVVDFIKLTFYHGLKRTWVAHMCIYIYTNMSTYDYLTNGGNPEMLPDGEKMVKTPNISMFFTVLF